MLPAFNLLIYTLFGFLLANWKAGELRATSTVGVVMLTSFLSGWHLFRIIPYTPMMGRQAKPWLDREENPDVSSARRLRLLVTNVEEENDQFELWRSIVIEQDADIIVVAEVDARWVEVIETLRHLYPNQILYPQDNWYGMAMLSRLPILKSTTRFLVQEDVPTIDAIVKLPSDDQVRVVGVHPQPPEPIRGNHSTARDAELALWGRELADDERPIVIGGDLNDVAWSRSTRLFLRLSRLLDPRLGRGFFNTFHAERFWMRFPLDHVFHSEHFAIRQLQRLPYVGSDHFPIFIDLQLDHDVKDDHAPPARMRSDAQIASDRLERAESNSELEPEPVDKTGDESASGANGHLS